MGEIINDIISALKAMYYDAKFYDGESLKDALFKAMDDGLEGKNIMYKGLPYKVKLSDKDKNEYLNKKIKTEDVVDSYMNNTLYTMENPTNKGYSNGKYYPYKDSSSDYNLGAGINITSDIARDNNLIFSDKVGYTKEELDSMMRPDLIKKMKDIEKDLHDMYGPSIDTMSMGNRQILLDIAHNVRPRNNRANMPSKWPKLTKAMAEGDVEAIKNNVYSGSTRRAALRQQLINQNHVDSKTVKNK